MSVKFKTATGVHDTGDCFLNLNLLAHSQLIELDIGSQCGGYGKCAGDKIILAEADRKKVSAPNAIELHQLTAEEIQKGFRLACQCFPNQNNEELVISLP